MAIAAQRRRQGAGHGVSSQSLTAVHPPAPTHAYHTPSTRHQSSSDSCSRLLREKHLNCAIYPSRWIETHACAIGTCITWCCIWNAHLCHVPSAPHAMWYPDCNQMTRYQATFLQRRWQAITTFSSARQSTVTGILPGNCMDAATDVDRHRIVSTVWKRRLLWQCASALAVDTCFPMMARSHRAHRHSVGRSGLTSYNNSYLWGRFALLMQELRMAPNAAGGSR